jgi:hypothetical protein
MTYIHFSTKGNRAIEVDLYSACSNPNNVVLVIQFQVAFSHVGNGATANHPCPDLAKYHTKDTH